MTLIKLVATTKTNTYDYIIAVENSVLLGGTSDTLNKNYDTLINVQLKELKRHKALVEQLEVNQMLEDKIVCRINVYHAYGRKCGYNYMVSNLQSPLKYIITGGIDEEHTKYESVEKIKRHVKMRMDHLGIDREIEFIDETNE